MKWSRFTDGIAGAARGCDTLTFRRHGSKDTTQIMQLSTWVHGHTNDASLSRCPTRCKAGASPTCMLGSSHGVLWPRRAPAFSDMRHGARATAGASHNNTRHITNSRNTRLKLPHEWSAGASPNSSCKHVLCALVIAGASPNHTPASARSRANLQAH